MIHSDRALERLIQQFSQPLAFLRELIQNSLDAGTESIEIDIEYDAEAEGCAITVSDTGEGMTREVIDTKLTRLFSSTKENDLTKIGKFGIGFVSIFAMNPSLVVLETGRQGEYWRVLFQPDRSFERRQMETPIEGTKVKLFTTLGRERLQRLVCDCRETIEYWCKHSHVEIFLNGQMINRPFQLDSPLFEYRYRTDATEAVLAPADGQAYFGYYNRGLTLLEGKGSPIEGVAFKVRSVHLEHTLTRDNVLQDDAYHKLIAELQKVGYEKMPLELFAALESRCDTDLWRAARIVWGFPGLPTKSLRRARVFPTRDGRKSLQELGSSVYYSDQVDEFRAAVEAAGFTVLDLGDSRHPCLKFLEDRSIETCPMEAGFVWFEVHEPRDDLERGLYLALERLLQRPFSRANLRLATLRQSPPDWTAPALLKAPEGISVVPAVSGQQLKDQPGGLVVLTDQVPWRSALALWASQPELALATLSAFERLLNLGAVQIPKSVLARLLRDLRQREARS